MDMSSRLYPLPVPIVRRSGHSGRYQNNLGIRRLCGICYHRRYCAKHSRVRTVHAIPPEIVCGQIEAVMEDLQPVAVKIGMVNDIQIVHVIADCIRKYSPEHIIYDPVMVSTSGRKLMTNEAIEEIKKELLPLVTLVTPNIDEAKVLTGNSIQNTQDMLEAAKQLSHSYQTHILIKGGHLEGSQMCDLLYSPDHTYYIYEEKKIESKNLHGTGCTLSSAIASYLAKGYSMKEPSVTLKNTLLMPSLQAKT